METDETGLNTIADTFETVITGIPTPVRKNFIKAFGQLCTAAVDIPVAWLEGKSAEIRTTTEARLQIIRKEGNVISEQVEVPREYITRASSKFAEKIVKEQLNLDKITMNAASELASRSLNETNTTEPEDISEDWLNEFENLAKLKSSEEMKLVFGKILSGEIIKPGSFSIKTMKLISQLDNQAAKLFQILCSQAISMRVGKTILDARVVAFGASAATNTMAQYGLSFDALNILQEYGLVISEYNSWMSYAASITNEQNKIAAILHFQNKNYGLMPIDKEQFDKILRLNGVALTKAGKELMDIIPITDSFGFKDELIKYFKAKHLDLVEIA